VALAIKNNNKKEKKKRKKMESMVWAMFLMMLTCVIGVGCCAIPLAVGLGVFLVFKSKKDQTRRKKMAEKFAPMEVPQDKAMGWSFEINGLKIEGVRFLRAFNPKVGEVFFAWNGRFGQPLIKQVPGRVVIYATKHPKYGWMFGGAEEPRIHCNGTMFTPAGGYDPAGGAELEAIEKMADGPDKTEALRKYGMMSAAREALEEMGLDVTNLKEVGHGLSNRSIYMVDLSEDATTWNGETYYLVVMSPNVLTEKNGEVFIDLPTDKEQDVQPSPEWSGIKKLKFRTFWDCTKSPDSVAVAGYGKAFTHCVQEIDNGVIALNFDQALAALKIAILAGE